MAADLDKSGLITRKDFKLALEYSIFFHRLAAVLDTVDTEVNGPLLLLHLPLPLLVLVLVLVLQLFFPLSVATTERVGNR